MILEDYELKIAQTIKLIRISKKLKQINLAYALNISESNYCKIENGTKRLTITQLKKIADYFGMSFVQLILKLEPIDILHFKPDPLSSISEWKQISEKKESATGLTDERVKYIMSLYEASFKK